MTSRPPSAAYQDVNLGELDDAWLAAQLRARAETMRRSAELHFLLGLPYEFGIHRLVVLCRQHLGWSPDHTLQPGDGEIVTVDGAAGTVTRG